MSDMNVMYVVNQDSEHAVSAIKKMAKSGKPGAFVMLTEDEFDAIRNEVQIIHLLAQTNE